MKYGILRIGTRGSVRCVALDRNVVGLDYIGLLLSENDRRKYKKIDFRLYGIGYRAVWVGSEGRKINSVMEKFLRECIGITGEIDIRGVCLLLKLENGGLLYGINEELLEDISSMIEGYANR